VRLVPLRAAALRARSPIRVCCDQVIMDVSGVVLLVNKACELTHVGRVERSAEYERRALAAAEALGAEDCLIVAKLQRFVANTTYVTEVKRWRATDATPQFASCVPLFMAAVTTLQRRRAAGTLLFGRCRAAETTFEQRISEHYADALGVRKARDTAGTVAQFIGYSTFLEVADLAKRLIALINNGLLVISPEQLKACIAFMADAAEVFLQPRPHENHHLGAEGVFAEAMQLLGQEPRLMVEAGGEEGVRFNRNFQRMRESGILERRRVQHSLEVNQKDFDADARAAAAAAAAAPGLRMCSLRSCGAREEQKGAFKACGACRGVVYCCKEHQAQHWPAHKAACKASRKTGANADT
jgi:hypothetical protein